MEVIVCNCGWEGSFEELNKKFVRDDNGRLVQAGACPKCGSTEKLSVAYDICHN